MVVNANGEGLLDLINQQDITLTKGEVMAGFRYQGGGALLLLGSEPFSRLPLAYANGVIKAIGLCDGQRRCTHIGHQRSRIIIPMRKAFADVLAQPADSDCCLNLAETGLCEGRYKERTLIDVYGCIWHGVDTAVGMSAYELHAMGCGCGDGSPHTGAEV